MITSFKRMISLSTTSRTISPSTAFEVRDNKRLFLMIIKLARCSEEAHLVPFVLPSEEKLGKFATVKSVLKNPESRKQIMNEIDMLRIVSGKHPNLPILRGIYQDKSNEHGICYIVTEICGGSSLFDAIADADGSTRMIGEQLQRNS